MFDEDSFGGLGGMMNGLGARMSNPLALAGLQMLANGSPQINKIPNTLEGVPNLLLTANTQQKKYQDEAVKTAAMMQALQDAGLSRQQASIAANNPQAAGLMLDTMNRRKNDAEANSYFGKTAPAAPPQQSAPAQAAEAPQAAPPPPQTAMPTQQQPQQAPAPVDPQQQALDAASKKFDDFGLASVGKTVEGFAASLGDKNKAANFMAAAQAQGLQPNSPINGSVLMNPAASGALAKSIGIGNDLSDDQWQAAHDAAVQTSRQRQADRAAAQQRFQQPAQGGQSGVPAFLQPMPQYGTPDAQMQTLPQHGTPNAQMQPLQQQAPQQPQNATERALNIREQSRVADLEAKIAAEERHLGSRNPTVAKAAASRIARYQNELQKQPQFTSLGYKDAAGNDVKGFVDVTTGKVTPVNAPETLQGADTGTFPGDTVEERLQSVPADKRGMVKSMLDGRAAPPGGAALKNPQTLELLRLANQVDPSFDQANWHERVTEAKSMASSGKTGKQITSINTLINHIGHLDSAIDKLGNTDYEWWNTPQQMLKGATGDTKFQKARADFETYRKGVADELVNLLRGGVGAASDVADWNLKVSMAKSPAELHAVVDAMQNLMIGRAKPLIDSHNRAFRSEKSVDEFLSPEAQQTLKDIQERRAGVGSAGPNETDKALEKRRTGRYPGNAPTAPDASGRPPLSSFQH